MTNLRRDFTSSAENGSSNSSNCGFANNALARTTLCASPPDSDSIFLLE